MRNVKPIDVARWFMSEGLDAPSDSLEGNMKLQKLLFFSQLIYMCQNDGKTMYDDEFNAFEHGMVLEEVRKEYQNNYKNLSKSNIKNVDFSTDILNALILTKEIFGNCNANELSDLSHQFETWNKYFRKSINKFGCFDTTKSKVPYNDLKEELYKMQKVLTAYELTHNNLNNTEADY